MCQLENGNLHSYNRARQAHINYESVEEHWSYKCYQ